MPTRAISSQCSESITMDKGGGMKAGVMLTGFLCGCAVLLAPPVLAAEQPFEARYEQAVAMLDTPQGAAYDQRLGESVMSSPQFEVELQRCERAYPGNHSLYGVYEFGEQEGEYRVVFQRDDGFARCIVKMLEGGDIPEPPQRPYLNPVEVKVLGDAI